MEIKFKNITEIFDFLEEIGYSVKKKNECCNCEKQEEDENSSIDKQKYHFPYGGQQPFTPTYPISPIVTFDNEKQDPEFSKKLMM